MKGRNDVILSHLEEEFSHHMVGILLSKAMAPSLIGISTQEILETELQKDQRLYGIDAEFKPICRHLP